MVSTAARADAQAALALRGVAAASSAPSTARVGQSSGQRAQALGEQRRRAAGRPPPRPAGRPRPGPRRGTADPWRRGGGRRSARPGRPPARAATAASSPGPRAGRPRRRSQPSRTRWRHQSARPSASAVASPRCAARRPGSPSPTASAARPSRQSNAASPAPSIRARPCLVVACATRVPPELAVHARDGRGRQRGEDPALGGVARRPTSGSSTRQRAAVAPGGGQAHAEQPAGPGGLGVQPLRLRAASRRGRSGSTPAAGPPVEGGPLTGGEQARRDPRPTPALSATVGEAIAAGGSVRRRMIGMRRHRRRRRGHHLDGARPPPAARRPTRLARPPAFGLRPARPPEQQDRARAHRRPASLLGRGTGPLRALRPEEHRGGAGPGHRVGQRPHRQPRPEHPHRHGGSARAAAERHAAAAGAPPARGRRAAPGVRRGPVSRRGSPRAGRPRRTR